MDPVPHAIAPLLHGSKGRETTRDGSKMGGTQPQPFHTN